MSIGGHSRGLLLFLILVSLTPIVFAAQATQFGTISPANAASVNMGTSVSFECNYQNSSGSHVPSGGGTVVEVEVTAGPGAPFNIVLGDTGTTWTGSYTFNTPGAYTWNCYGHGNPTYSDLRSSGRTLTINPTWCNLAWDANPSSPGDFKTNHYSQVVGGTVYVAVKLTDSGGPKNGVTVSLNLPAGWGGPITSTPSDASGLASASFAIGTTTAGSYGGLSVDAPLCVGGVTPQPSSLATVVNAFHAAPSKIFVSDPNPPALTRNIAQTFSITAQVQDTYGNICDSSYDGTEYVTTNSTPTFFSHVIAIRQQMYNITPTTLDYNPIQCTVQTGNNCTGFLNAGDGAKHTFTLLAYAWPPGVAWLGIRNTAEEISMDISAYPTPSISPGSLTDSQMVVMTYTQPLPPTASGLSVKLIPNSIKSGGSFVINITALLPNGSVDTSYNSPVTITRAERKDLPPTIAPQKQIAPPPVVTVTNGIGSYIVSAAASLADFNISGVYTILVSDGRVPTPTTGKGFLSVSASGIDHIDVVVDPIPVFTTLPFTVNATMRDVAGNPVVGFSGEVNMTCPETYTDPAAQNASMNLSSTAIFTQIANKTGTFTCNITAFDVVNNVNKLQPFTVVVVEPLGCVNFSIPPNPITVPPVDVVVNTSQIPPVHDVMEQNAKIGNMLIGYDPVSKKMKGNYSICLESYYNGRSCFNDSDIQFDKSPVSVCVKEFIYNPQADGRISDHLNYNGTGDLEDTFKHPEVLWGWGYKPYDGTSWSCTGNTKYTVEFKPGTTMYQDYFNITVGLPLTVLEPYNITNETPLNPHELRAPEALLVVDDKNDGRLAKFDMKTPATWLEEYSQSIIGSGAQAITYDNRGNIYVALSNSPKILVLKLVRALKPTLLFVKEIDVKTLDGSYSFQPYGLDTDSWGNLFVVGNTNPDSPENQMCINVYNKSFDLNQSNNCCDNGNCSQKWEGTVRDIAVQEDGAAFYIARDKRRVCDATVGWPCWWEGWPYIEQYNGTNVSQSKANISILGSTGGIDLWSNNPNEQLLDAPCKNNAGTEVIVGNISDSGTAHFLRGLRYRKGYLFILDYMAYDHHAGYSGCSGLLDGKCNGCCVPWPDFLGACCNAGGCCMWCYDPNACNGCLWFDTYQNQQTRIIAMDLANYPDKSYIARAVLEPNTTICLTKASYDPFGVVNPGLQIRDTSYLTHGIDVDNKFNVYIALKGVHNGIVRYRFLPGLADPTLTIPSATSSSFQRVQGYDPASGSPGVFTYVTDNTTTPDDVIGYPDLIKESMMAGVSCEGCSLEGSVQPSVCQGEVEQTNASSYSSLQDMLAGGKIAAGAPAVHVTSALNPVYRRNFITTNITAYLRFYYDFKVTTSNNDPACGGGASSAGPTYNINNKQLNLTSSSNNLTIPVEGGGDYFALTRPNYPEKPPQTPNTLPYLAYDYLTNRFFYKHYPLIDNVSSLMGGSVDKDWMINASYRKSFQTMENKYYAYQYISTVPTVNDMGIQDTLYNPNGTWSGPPWIWSGDNSAPQYLNPGAISSQFPAGTVPYNNTMNWTYPFAYVFTPATLQPNPLPFTPQDAPVAPAAPDYDFKAITNVSMLQLTLSCNTSTNAPRMYTATITNTSFTDLGPCFIIDTISISGASGEASLFIMPTGLAENNGICFESIYGVNVSLCGTTRAWFRESIKPNTVLSHTSLDKDILVPTRYPLAGEPYASLPSSLIVIPIHMSGPTLLTIHGFNSTPDYITGKLSRIQGSVDLMGKQLPNPLPLRAVQVNGLYFRSDGNLTLAIDTTIPQHVILSYTTDLGWIQVTAPPVSLSGDIVRVSVIDGCQDGCLLQFANDSAGLNLAGEIFLWKLNYAYADPVTSIKDPSLTYMPTRGRAQVVPDDPLNREFREISSVSGKGYLGDSFGVYVDPNVIIRIDNITAGNCTTCSSDAECPGGVCSGGNCEFPNVPKCKVAEHPSGSPCIESFVCPRIELSLLNESLEVYSDKDHDASNVTRVTVVGTDVISGTFKIINGTTTLISYTNHTNKSLGGPFSDVYIVEVTNATKGETLVFQTAMTKTEVARLYMPSENYVSKSSIGTILPNPRRLRINSDNPAMGRTIPYIIKGTIGNTVPYEEIQSGTTTTTCSLSGPSIVTPDVVLTGCEFKFDPIPTPQTAGSPFSIRIMAVPTGTLYPVTIAESSGCSNPTRAQAPPTFMLGAPNGNGSCFWESNSAYPSVPPGIYGTFGRSLSIAEFDFTIQANGVSVNTPLEVLYSNSTNCWSEALSNNFANFKHYMTFTPDVANAYKKYIIRNGTVDAMCFRMVDLTMDGYGFYVDALGIYPPTNICPFDGNITLVDTTGSLCPTTAGPFYHGVWSGMAQVQVTGTNVAIGAANGPATGTSNLFNVTTVPGVSLVSFDTQQAFTHVLAIRIEGGENEHFNITTRPLVLDEPYPLHENDIEQIGIINVVPDDFVIGFHQNVSGTYLYSQRDSVVLNIPDNKSLGLHNFDFAFYDRFNNTFLPNYTIWLRQPTTTILSIQTDRDSGNINKTNVYVTAQLLYQRYDKPDEKPNIPLPNQQIEIYVQNSSNSSYSPCNPATAGVCPNPAITMNYVEQSNCSCPDWWDVPGGTGECMPNPMCHQYGKIGTFTTDAGGQITANFSIYGFGRRLAFAVFWGTDIYAPSIDIKPFYAGGVSIGMGSFDMFEPVLVVTISLALLTLKRKFNKQKKKNI